jgi:hypothetical protein
VQWHLEAGEGGYTKRLDGKTGKPLPEDNWVWSPQGAINMHMPERWGYVQFSDVAAGTHSVPFVEQPNERVKWALRRLYYRQRGAREATGRYATTLDALKRPEITVEGLEFRPTITATASHYEITAPGFNGATVHINQDGRVWVTR